MLRHICYSFCILGASFSLHAKEELSAIEELINRSERQLTTQKFLKELMLDLEKQENIFMKGKFSKQDASNMVETAHQILMIIEENHYSQFFPPIYIEELKLFSKIAAKNNPQIANP